MRVFLPFLRLFSFWIAVFFLNRLIFLAFHQNQLSGISLTEPVKSFFYGLSLDISAACYLMIFPFLLFVLTQGFRERKLAEKIIFYYHISFIALIAILNGIDLNIYREWGSKLNNRALEFLFLSPGEALASSASSPLFLSLLIITFTIFAGIVLLKYYVRFSIERLNISSIKETFAVLLVPFLLFTGLRGGFELSPINQSKAYFSEVPFLNHAALNTEWNLLHSSIENSFDQSNPYLFFENGKACAEKARLYPDSISTVNLFRTDHPNVVYIILESFTSDVIEAAGGEKGVTPFINSIAKEGLFFGNMYASGDRTDKGLIAILSSFPAQGARTIIQQPDKFEKLPSIAGLLRDKGYTTSFMYGGELEFSNFKSYLLSSGYQELIGKEIFTEQEMNSKWGAHDEFVLQKHLQYLNRQKQPFFSTVLTLSSHEPFEVPISTPFKGKELPDKFRSAAYYTDHSLKNYFEQAKKQPWFKNTVFILVADHGHRLPKEYQEGYNYRKFRIPVLFYGEALHPQWQKKYSPTFGSQTDINATLLSGLGIKENPFPWSSNLLDTTREQFAFYSFDNGFGWASPEQVITFDNISKRVIYKKKRLPDSLNKVSLDRAKAYMQCVYQTYLDY